MYVSQGIATETFGITFRSKLEAMWAYELAKFGTDWDYVDSHWHDFMFGGEMPLEIKPKGMEFLLDALSRAWPFRSQWHQGHAMTFLCGEPDTVMSCLARVMDCDSCASLDISNGARKTRLAWSPDCGPYGYWCEHDEFNLFSDVGIPACHAKT